MKNLEVEKILEYYDVPQLFTARDDDGCRYICLLYSHPNGEMDIVGVGVSTVKLMKFLGGEIDLLSMFLNPEDGYHIVDVNTWYYGRHFALERKEPLEDYMLPDEGYFYKENKDEEGI